MNRLRLLMVTDRFWPIVDSEALALEQLCRAMARRGEAVRVLMRSWQKYWPATLQVGEIDVVRLPFAPRTRFGNLRLARQLNHWLEIHRDEFDVLVVDPQSELCSPVIAFAARHEVPLCVCQLSSTEPAKWSALWPRIRRHVSALHSHACWIVHQAPLTEQLCGAGADPQRVVVLGPPIDCSSQPTVTRSDARAALADNHPTLVVPPNEPLVVSFGEWDSSRGACEWVDAWRWVRQSFPCAKLWLIGNGTEILKIADHIRHRQLVGDVILTGAFDDWGDVLSAADLLIQTESGAFPSLAALAAMQRGLPVMVNEEKPASNWASDLGVGFGYVSGDSRKIAHQVIEILEQPAAREAKLARAKQLVMDRHDLANFAARLERLARDLVEHREQVQS